MIAVPLFIHPVTIEEAKKFVARHHRTHPKPPLSGLFAVGVAERGQEYPAGVAIVGRPSARHLQDGFTAEVTRLCTRGHRNACSMLLGACWRAARSLGYHKLITYTLAKEGGASIRGAGFRAVAQVRGHRKWDTPSRPRADQNPNQEKLRWERSEESR